MVPDSETCDDVMDGAGLGRKDQNPLLFLSSRRNFFTFILEGETCSRMFRFTEDISFSVWEYEPLDQKLYDPVGTLDGQQFNSQWV